MSFPEKSKPAAFFNAPAFRGMVLRLGVAAVAVVSCTSFVRGAPGLVLDDSYIHLSFARHLGEGMGFCFNPGERSLGFTSPLWVMLLGSLYRAGVDLEAGARWAGILSLAGSAVLLFGLVRLSVRDVLGRHGPGFTEEACSRWSDTYGLLAGLGMSACGNMLWLSGSGMEAVFFLFMGLCCLLFFRREKPRPLWGGVFLGLLLLTRVTGVLLLVLLAAFGLIRSRRHVFVSLAAALVIALPWYIYSYSVTGFILPPTRAGKLASDLFNSGPALKGISTYAVMHLQFLWKADKGILIMLLLSVPLTFYNLVAKKDAGHGSSENGRGTSLAARPLSFASVSPAGLLGLWAILHFLAHTLFFRSTMILTPYHNLRYQVMLIPALIGGFTYIIARTLAMPMKMDAEGPDESNPYPGHVSRWSGHLYLAVGLLLLATPIGMELLHTRQWQGLFHANVRHLNSEHKAAANWARLFLGEDARIACLDIGVLRFYSDRYVIDLGGLVDPEILPWLEKNDTGPYLVEKKATHYFEMDNPGSERITGVKARAGGLYELRPLKQFKFHRYPYPVFLHSFAINAYAVRLLDKGPGG